MHVPRSFLHTLQMQTCRWARGNKFKAKQLARRTLVPIRNARGHQEYQQKLQMQAGSAININKNPRLTQPGGKQEGASNQRLKSQRSVCHCAYQLRQCTVRLLLVQSLLLWGVVARALCTHTYYVSNPHGCVGCVTVRAIELPGTVWSMDASFVGISVSRREPWLSCTGPITGRGVQLYLLC